MNTTLKVAWSSPSNIALVKYWGKRPDQIPCNPSVSFTLSKSKTELSIEATLNISQHEPQNEIKLDFYFEGEKNEKFKVKIEKFLNSKLERFPWLHEFSLVVRSENTFPHSSGIASSASSMSALNLCLLSLDQEITGQKIIDADFYKEASDLSRQASGSAGRSVYPFLVTWGEIAEISESSDFVANPVNKNDIDPIFYDYCDSIIIVDGGEKSVSSRAGHALMDNHPFKEERFKRAQINLSRLLAAMKCGDLNVFHEIVEEEALMLHALMMTSNPSYILLKPESLLLIEKIREFRETKKIPVCFTIDAGPNVHLLYPKKFKKEVQDWLSFDFGRFKIIHDEVGFGPVRLGT